MAHGLTRLSLNAYDLIVTMSSRMKRELKAAAPQRRVVTVPDPLDLALFTPQSKLAARQALFGSNSTAPWILFTSLSSDNPVKRVELAQQAVRIAAVAHPGLELRVASGMAHAAMPAFVSSCDVALCTSTHEGWPNSIKEALACGLPFVATDVSDLAEIARRHPACRIASPDPQALADALCATLRSPPDPTLRSEVEPMGIEAISQRLLDAYSTVLSK